MYNLERAADQAIIPVSYALVAVGVTYGSVTGAAVLRRADADPMPSLVRYALPLVLMLIYGSLVELDWVSQLRGYYLDQLEKCLAALHDADVKRAYGAENDLGELALPAVRQLTRSYNHQEGDKKPRVRILFAGLIHPYSLGALSIGTYVWLVINSGGSWGGCWDRIVLAVYLVGIAVLLGVIVNAQTRGPFNKALQKIARHKEQSDVDKMLAAFAWRPAQVVDSASKLGKDDDTNLDISSNL